MTLVLTVVATLAAVMLAVTGYVEVRHVIERRTYNSTLARQNRIAQLEVELGITSPMYAEPAKVAQVWDDRFAQAVEGARYAYVGLPAYRSPRRSAEEIAAEQAAVEATRARRKEVARRAAQKREGRRS